MCRHDPKRFQYWVKQVYKEHVLLRGGLGKREKELLAKLNTQEQLRAVKIDSQASEACRQNNQAVVDKEEAAPTKGGNIAKFTELSGGDKAASCYEFTMAQFEGSRGEEFIALQLALDFEGLNESTKKAAEALAAAKKESEPAAAAAEKKPEAPIEPEAAPNAMDAGSAPNAMDAGSAEKPEGEVKEAPKPAEPAPKPEAKPEAKPATDKKDPKKAAPAGAPGYSPILDAEIEQVGIAMKAHKKTTNLIQVIYCKPAANVMA